MDRTVLLLARGLAIAALAVSLGGCAPPKFDVTGKVTYNGKVLAKPKGKIVFDGPDKRQVEATIGEDGTYKAVGVSTGLNRVAVYYPNPDYKPIGRPKGPPPKGQPATPKPYLTPDQYANPEQSDLKIEVNKQGKTFDVDMKGPEIP